jgi:hypothetical protein
MVSKYIGSDTSLQDFRGFVTIVLGALEVTMLDNEKQELHRDMLKRVLAPLNRRNDKVFKVLAVSLVCLIAEFPIFMFSFMMFFYLAAVLLLPFDFVSDFSENLIIYVSLIFLIAVPHIIANIIAVSLKKKIFS